MAETWKVLATQMDLLEREIADLRKKLDQKESDFEYLRQSLAKRIPDRTLYVPEHTVSRSVEQLIVDFLVGARGGYFASDIRFKVSAQYGEQIQANSFRSRLSRLKREGLVEKREDGKWYATLIAPSPKPIRHLDRN